MFLTNAKRALYTMRIIQEGSNHTVAFIFFTKYCAEVKLELYQRLSDKVACFWVLDGP